MHSFIYIICLVNYAGSSPTTGLSDVFAPSTFYIQPWQLERDNYYDRELEVARQTFSGGQAYGTGNSIEYEDTEEEWMQPIDEDMSQGFQSFGKPQIIGNHITYYSPARKTY